MDITKSTEEDWTQWMCDLTRNGASNGEPIELYDWLINEKTLRGSMKNDRGLWMSNSPKPVKFDPITRIVELENNTKFIINKPTICKALGLHKTSEKELINLAKL